MKRPDCYITWSNIKQRCYNKKSTSYPRYGAKGIKVCDRWLNFDNFYEDMGDKPKDKTIRRINAKLDYSPENCVWANFKNKFLSTEDKIKISTIKLPTDKIERRKKIKDIAKEYKVNYQTIQNIFRIKRSGTEGKKLVRYEKAMYNSFYTNPEVNVNNAGTIIEDIYKDVFKKQPDKIRHHIEHGIFSAVILPEIIMIQMDELLCFKEDKFRNAIKRIIETKKENLSNGNWSR